MRLYARNLVGFHCFGTPTHQLQIWERLFVVKILDRARQPPVRRTWQSAGTRVEDRPERSAHAGEFCAVLRSPQARGVIAL
jgi:hypothetical protein